MLSYLENILQATTGKSALEEVSIEELRQLIERYPYFGAAQFLLAKKLHTNNDSTFKEAVQKTALHFNNTLLLHFNLFEEEDKDVITNNLVIDKSLDTAKNEIAGFEVNAINNNESSNTEEKKLIDEEQNEEVYEDENDETTDESPEVIPVEENEKLSNLLKEQAEAFSQPVEETTLPVETLPPHRIDYFESQGIKLDPEKEVNDKLGTQVKRFTDWLKQMKRINPNLNNLEADIAGEIQAQNMAARSNDPKEVVTEAMADVLIKQGKPDEAIAIYEKLSFSNPSKSAYFAEKIQELKA